MSKTENNFIKIGKEKKQSGTVAFLTYIGAAVYFVNQVDGFWDIVAALLKAAVWCQATTFPDTLSKPSVAGVRLAA